MLAVLHVAFFLFLGNSVTSVPLTTAPEDLGEEWSSWTRCSVTEGEGSMYRYRADNGKSARDVMKCFVQPCECPTSATGTDPVPEVQTPTEEPEVTTVPVTDEITPEPFCGKSLGASFDGTLSPSNFEATSIFNEHFGPGKARLCGPLSWCSSPSSVYDFAVSNEFLQVDLGAVSQICAVATQGYRKQRIYSFELHYSLGGKNWTSVKEDGDDRIFIRSARENANTAVVHELDSPIMGRYIRFRIRRFIGWPCLKVEIYGEGRSITPTQETTVMTEETTKMIPTTAQEKTRSTKETATTAEIIQTTAKDPTTPTEATVTTAEILQTTAAPKGVEEQALEMHNDYRKVHNAAPLRLNSALNPDALRYAKTLFNLGARGALEHSSQDSRPGQGENLARACSFGEPMRDFFKTAITTWYKEVCDYDFDLHAFQSGLGHFSQLVWKATSEMGIAEYSGPIVNGSVTRWCSVVVARYKTAGNVNRAEYFRANVDKGSFVGC